MESQKLAFQAHGSKILCFVVFVVAFFRYSDGQKTARRNRTTTLLSTFLEVIL